MSRMSELHYQVSFATPAFLGNAQQQAQWRSPPLKTLLRQWWRIVKAPATGYDHRRLLADENHLFGSAGGDEAAGRSLIRMRLSDWGLGTLNRVDRGETVTHPEVRSPVGANLYLGYGPIGGVDRSAIAADAGISVNLALRLPDEFVSDVKAALQLAHWFGTVGSRSRNGFGSIHFQGEGLAGLGEMNLPALAQIAPLSTLGNALKRDWPHAIAGDADPFIWRLFRAVPNAETGKTDLHGFARWEDAMRELARIKIAVRTSPFFKFSGGGREGHAEPQARHVLSYPSGSSHAISGWGNNGRLANQVRFKVHRRGPRDHVAVIAHLPCALPRHMADQFAGRIPDQSAVWTEVHRLLDQQRSNGLMRLKGSPA